MADALLHEQAAEHRDLDVLNWRFSQLCDAGYPVEEAILLSKRADVDLHFARRLLERGASVQVALRILS